MDAKCPAPLGGGLPDGAALASFVLLPKRWIVERSFAWATRLRRLVRDYERYATTLAKLHLIAFVCLMMKQAAFLIVGS